MKKLILASAVLMGLISLMIWPMASHAAEFRTDSSGSIIISEKDSPKDLYTTSGNVTVNANVMGDLVAAGGTVLVNGNVEDSLFVGGGTVTIRGQVGRHVRVSGGTVTISSKIKGDLLVAGGTVEITSDANIGGSLYASGGTIHIDGTVVGETKISGGEVTLGGNLTGTTTVQASKLQVSSSAVLSGDLWLTAPLPADISQGAVIKGQTHYTVTPVEPFLRQFASISLLLQLLGAMILGWLIWRFWPKTTESLVGHALQSPFPTLWLGLGVLVLTPIILIILMVSLIGLPLAFVLGLIWMLAIAIGSIVGKIIFGSWLVRLVTKDRSSHVDVQIIVIGILLLALLRYVPFVGPLVAFIFFLLGFGTVIHLFRSLGDRHLASTK